MQTESLALNGGPDTSRRTEVQRTRNGHADGRTGERLALSLGWFSVGLGLAELLATEQVARLIGVEDDDRNRIILRTMGAREIAAGVAILAQPDRPAWLWARVAGDALDLALLGNAFGSDSARRTRLAGAVAAVVGATALDVFAGSRLQSHAGRRNGATADLATHVERSITVWRPREEVYVFWRNFENLPRFMKHLESVRVIDDRRSLWTATAPAGRTVEWEADLVEDRPNELIAWRSVEGSDVHHAGSVRFTPSPGGDGTEITVSMDYDPPGGAIGKTLAKLFMEEPSQQVQGDLRRFKQVMETGEVIRSTGTMGGKRLRQPPARPRSTGRR